MLRVLISSIWAAANAVLNNNQIQNPTTDPPSTSKWRIFRNFILSTISTIGIPLARSITENDTVYEYVNTFLGNSTTTRNNLDHHHQQQNSNLSRFSRPNFRRRSHHNGGNVRIIKPTIHIHIHQT